MQRVLVEAGYEVVTARTRPNPPKTRRFERARPNQLWQTDLFSFYLKRQRRRVHLVGYMDDCSRFVVGFGLFGTASGANVREVFESAIANYGAPEEILTDQGAQYHTWRGRARFGSCASVGASGRWWRESAAPADAGQDRAVLGDAVAGARRGGGVPDLDEARASASGSSWPTTTSSAHTRALDGLVPADRYFEAAPEVRAAIERAGGRERASELALHGGPRKRLYLTGRIGDKAISLHSEGTKVVLTDGDGVREEVDLSAPGRRRGAGDERAGRGARGPGGDGEFGRGEHRADGRRQRSRRPTIFRRRRGGA